MTLTVVKNVKSDDLPFDPFYQEKSSNIVKIYPRHARYILDNHNSDNRPIKKCQIKAIKDNIDKNGILFDGVPLTFNVEGNITEKQHFLSVLSELPEDEPVPLVVVTGVEVDTFSKAAQSRPRTYTDEIQRKFGERGAPKENIATVADIVKRSRRLKNININNGVKYWCDFESEVKIALRYTKPFRKRTKKFAKATKTLNAWAALCIRNNMDKECKMVLGLLGDQIVLPGEQTKLMRGALDVWHDNLVSDLSHDKTLWLVFVLLCSLTDAVQRYPKGDTEFPLAPHDVIALASARDARKNVKKYSATLDKFTK